MDNYHHKLAAIMFTDIAGYTALMGRNESKALELLNKNREIHKPLIERYQGKFIKEMGDGILAHFDSAYDAIRCAIEIQEKSRREFKGEIRIGLHIGDIIIENNDIFGDGVNIASRIESIADPGGVYLSDAFQKAIQNHTDIHTQYLAEVRLKNVDDPVKIYCVIAENLKRPAPNKIKQLKGIVEKENTRDSRKYRKPLYYFLGIVLLLCLITFQYWYNIKPDRPIQAIAVLPFANFTGKVEEQYFVDMMHDAVIGELSKIGDLVVKSRTSTLQFKDTQLTIPQIAKMLDVDAIIESSVFKTGDSVVMQVQLIRARPKEDHIWAEDYERSTKHILSMYGDLAQTVASEVEVQLTPQEKRQLTHKEEVNPEAYKAYLNGQFHWNKLTKADLDIAENYFNLAKEIDPNYPLAYVGLANVEIGRVQMGLAPWHEFAINSTKYLNKALEIDSTLSDVHFLVAAFNSWGLWNFKKAAEEYQTTIKFNPNAAKARVYYSHVLCIGKNYEEAIRQCEKAMQIDPYNNLLKGIYGQTLNFCRKYDEADSLFNHILAVEPHNSIALSNLKSTYHLKNEFEKAYNIWLVDYGNDPEAQAALEDGYKKGGYQEALKSLADLFVIRSSKVFVTPWRICTLYTRAGLKEEALKYLEKAYDAHDPNMPYINTDAIFDYMRDDPKFQTILTKMNFPKL